MQSGTKTAASESIDEGKRSDEGRQFEREAPARRRRAACHDGMSDRAGGLVPHLAAELADPGGRDRRPGAVAGFPAQERVYLGGRDDPPVRFPALPALRAGSRPPDGREAFLSQALRPHLALLRAERDSVLPDEPERLPERGRRRVGSDQPSHLPPSAVFRDLLCQPDQRGPVDGGGGGAFLPAVPPWCSAFSEKSLC